MFEFDKTTDSCAFRHTRLDAPTIWGGPRFHTGVVLSFCLTIASNRVINPKIPTVIPARIVSAKAGHAPIPAKTVLPAGIVWYIVFLNGAPMINNTGIATMRATEHLPSVSSGAILQVCFVILFTF
jgi:hypothetical protein